MPDKYVINPHTGRKIQVGGPTHQKLLAYPGVPNNLFCGSKPRSFPVDSIGRARAAISRAHFDRNPSKVKKCARKRLDYLKQKCSRNGRSKGCKKSKASRRK